MDEQVDITLTSTIDGITEFSQRKINLNPNKSLIEVGRASKSLTKGLIAAPDNAWFDSPVMSRTHAELQFDPQDKVVKIHDVGSMHGTYVNDIRLSRGESRALQPEDTLTFGIQVKRGLETFPACAFHVDYNLSPFKSTTRTSTFSVPDSSSDIDDGAQVDTPDSQSGHNDISDDSPHLNSSQALNSIDLTKEDSLEAQDAEGLYIVQTSVEKRPATAVPHPGSTYTFSKAILLESDDEDDLSPDSDSDQILIDDDSDSQDSGPDQSTREIDESNLVNIPSSCDSEDEDTPSVTSPASGQQPATFPDSRSSAIATPLFEASKFECMSEVDSNEESEVSCESCDISAAGEDDIKELFGEEGIQDSFEMNVDDSESGLHDTDKSASTPHLEFSDRSIPRSVQFVEISSPDIVIPGWVSQPDESRVCSSSNAMFNSLEPASTNIRQPSPSDAAMVKPSVPVNPSQVASPMKATHQILGEKTGKIAFFEARDVNKAKFQGGNDGAPTLPHIAAPPSTQAPGHQDVIQLQMNMLKSQNATRRSMDDAEEASVDLSWPKPDEPLRFLDDHFNAPFIHREPSPEPDMTSAVKFNESKASMAATNKTAATFIGRSGLRIPDIVNKPATDQNGSKKRKAEEISTNSLAAWGDEFSATTELTKAQAEEPFTENHGKSSRNPPKTADTPDVLVERPTKRVKRIVERLGYATLGGLAVGAGLFSALVATAPDFI